MIESDPTSLVGSSGCAGHHFRDADRDLDGRLDRIGFLYVQQRKKEVVGLPAGILTRLVSWVSIMKLWTCFSARVSSNFLETTATSNAVQPAPFNIGSILNQLFFGWVDKGLIGIRARSRKYSP
jgi:hypothetical protein